MYRSDFNRYINAGTNEFYRYGKKAQERITRFLTPNEKGFYNMPADGGDYYTIGTSNGKYGEFAKFGDEFLSVNSNGNVWAKVGTRQAETFCRMIERLLFDMREQMKSRTNNED